MNYANARPMPPYASYSFVVGMEIAVDWAKSTMCEKKLKNNLVLEKGYG